MRRRCPHCLLSLPSLGRGCPLELCAGAYPRPRGSWRVAGPRNTQRALHGLLLAGLLSRRPREALLPGRKTHWGQVTGPGHGQPASQAPLCGSLWVPIYLCGFFALLRGGICITLNELF